MSSDLSPEFKTAQAVATDIARELRERPEMWRKFNFGPADAPRCLLGHINTRIGIEFNAATHAMRKPFYDALNGGSVMIWNDHADRTVADIIALCDKVAAS